LSPDVLLAGSIGALSVFVLGVFRDFVRRRRELRGIARLVHTEISFNHLALGDFYRNPERVFSPVVGAVQTDTWESVRVRLAEMMPADDFGSLVFYYSFLQDIRRMPAITHGGPVKSAIELAENQLSIISNQEQDARDVALAYTNLGVLLGWRRMRRRIYKHRRQSVSDKESLDISRE
jgi:hypothetical protein